MALVVCGECKTEISSDAKTCPKCGKKQGPGAIAKLAGFAFVVFVIIVVKGAVSGGGSSSGASSSGGSASAPLPPAMVVSPSVLMKEYEANEVSADQRYKGQRLSVTGKVGKIAKDILDDMYITIDTGHVVWSVQAFFKKGHESQLAALAQGATVTVECRCAGKMANVLLKDCLLK